MVVFTAWILLPTVALQVIAILVASAILMTILFGIIAWKTGYLRSLFFEIEDGSLAFVDSGETNVFVYLNEPGYVLRWGLKIEDFLPEEELFYMEPKERIRVVNDWVRVKEEYPGQSKDEKTFIQRKWGLYWRGFEFFNRKVHIIPLTKKKSNANMRPGMPPEEWVEGSDEVVMVDQLRTNFPRPVLVPDMKFFDGVEANLLAQATYEIVIPRLAVYNLKGEFFGSVVQYTRAGVADVYREISSVFFSEDSKIESGELPKKIVRVSNRQLVFVCGVRMTGVSIPVYNLSSDAEEKARKAAALAELEGQAAVAEANAKAQVTEINANAAARAKIIDATAEAQADNLRNAASITDVTLAAEALVKLGVHPDIAAQGAAAVGRATRYSDPNSKVTTQVEGGGIIAIPPIERKVVLAER